MAAPSNRIGRYEILEPLGRAGMGSGYLARDPTVGRLVAIKLFPIEDNELRVRFAREAHSVARLRHPNIEAIFEVGEHDGKPFIVAEYIQGDTLAEIILRHEPLSLSRKIQIVEDVCAALDYAHRNGLVHRDIAPSQIVVTFDGVAKIRDFGAVYVAASQITQAGMTLETLNYLSPEQLTGTVVDARSDVFALGAVLYEFITYTKAFPGNIGTGVFQHIISGEPEPASSLAPVLPPELDRIIERSLKKNPAQRYTDAGLMRRDLSRVRASLETREELDSPTMMQPAPSRPKPSPGRFDRESFARRRVSQIERYLSEAQQAFDQGHFEDAIAACESALILEPDSRRMLELLGRSRAALDERLILRVVEEVRQQLEIGGLTTASNLLDQAATIIPSLPPDSSATTEIQRLRLEVVGRLLAEESAALHEAAEVSQQASKEARRRAEEEAKRSVARVEERPMPEIVPVFYATDRRRSGRASDLITYGSERSLSGLAYGCTFVSIPPSHRRGHLERPSILRLEFRENPDRHVVAFEITEYTKEMFFDQLQKALAGPDERTTFVFIHGFNVDFDEAVRRTAQLGFDLGLRKAPILYSWPSQGSTLQYIADTNAAIWTVPHLAEFLRELQEHSGATSIHLIAHSMGNQALTGALRTLRAASSLPRIFKQVVLTAPDLDAHVFERDLAPQIVGLGERTTLYASSRDEVLSVSKRLNAYRRAGDAGEGIVIVEGVDSIDASQVSTGLGHSTYGDVRTVIEDLSLLLRLGLPPGSRNLVARGTPPKQHWVFPA